jgi:putative restriction endonuclease
MNCVVANTDFSWYQFCRERPDLDEVNFWRPGRQPFRALLPGEPFFFKLKSPQNAIGGFGLYSQYSIQPVWRAWELFGEGNGVAAQWDLLKRLTRLSGGSKELSSNRMVGCISVVDPVFFDPDEWVAAPDDWSPNIVSLKKYDTTTGEGKRIYRECLERAEAMLETPEWVPEMADNARLGKPQLILPRLGQGSFRQAVLQAYGGACAITTEHALPAVEAAHIKSWHQGGTHEISNGIPLRRDIHHLFDLGYVTVTPERRFRVSEALEDEFANGKAYYAMEGTEIIIPSEPEQKPSGEALAWHNEMVFRG